MPMSAVYLRISFTSFLWLPLALSRASEQQLIQPVALTVTCEVLQYSAPDSQVPGL